jgi:hypothetical protein
MSGVYDKALDALGHVVEVGDADEELTEIHPSDRHIESINSIRESTYVRHCRNRAGEVISEEAFVKSKEARERLQDSTLDMAFKMRSAGRDPFARADTPTGFIVCPFTGRFHVMAKVKARAIFPTVAAAKRAKMIAALELILRQGRHKYDLMCTFTGGQRVPLEPAYHGPCLPQKIKVCGLSFKIEMGKAGWKVRLAIRVIQRRISKLQGEEFMKAFGAQFIFRSSELGSLVDQCGNVKRDENGYLTVHPHAHAILHLDRYLGGNRMAALTRRIGAYWGHHWDVGKALENVREACKYPFKPGETDKLTGEEICHLDDALFRLHRVQPLGELREQIAARRESVLTVKRERRMVRSKDGKPKSAVVPVVISDWNGRKPDRKKKAKPVSDRCNLEAKQNQRNYAGCEQALDRMLTPAEARELGRVGVGETRELIKREASNAGTGLESPETTLPWSQRVAGETSPSPVANRIVARLSPAPYFDRVSRPALMVWNYDGNFRALRNQPFVMPALVAVARQVRAGAKSLSVHTSPVTVRGSQPDLPWRSAEDSTACRKRRKRPELAVA